MSRPAGLTAAIHLAERGHAVGLFDGGDIGGQLAWQPGAGKEGSCNAAYFRRKVRTRVELRLNTRVAAADLAGCDEVVVATGITPRDPKIPARTTPRCWLPGRAAHKPVGLRVAIVGAGVGFDVAEYLVVPMRGPCAQHHHRPARLASRVGRDRPSPGPGGSKSARKSALPNGR